MRPIKFSVTPTQQKILWCVCGGIKFTIVNILLGRLSPRSGEKISIAATNPERLMFPLPVNDNYLKLAESSVKRTELELRKGIEALGTTFHNYTLKVNCEER
jgi:hypothetical protein